MGSRIIIEHIAHCKHGNVQAQCFKNDQLPCKLPLKVAVLEFTFMHLLFPHLPFFTNFYCSIEVGYIFHCSLTSQFTTTLGAFKLWSRFCCSLVVLLRLSLARQNQAVILLFPLRSFLTRPSHLRSRALLFPPQSVSEHTSHLGSQVHMLFFLARPVVSSISCSYQLGYICYCSFIFSFPAVFFSY